MVINNPMDAILFLNVTGICSLEALVYLYSANYKALLYCPFSDLIIDGLSSMRSIEHRRYKQSLTLFYKCVKEQCPAYINLFKPRSTQYNLRNSGLSVEQPSYSGLFYHNSFTLDRTYLEPTYD